MALILKGAISTFRKGRYGESISDFFISRQFRFSTNLFNYTLSADKGVKKYNLFTAFISKLPSYSIRGRFDNFF
jgi:hypothetical protein